MSTDEPERPTVEEIIQREAEYAEKFENFDPPELPEHLSPSQIKSLLLCSEQYRLTRLLKAPERPMWASIGGSTVHTVTEKLDREAYDRGEA